MKSIKINIALPKASELSQDLNTLLSQVQSKTKLSLDIDVTAFKTSIAEVSQLLGKLKTQISSMGSVGELLKSSSITQSTKDLERQNVLLREQQRLLSERSIIKTSSSEVVNSDRSRTLLSDLEKTRDEYGNIIEVVNTYNKKSGEITSTIINTTSEVEKQRVASEKALASVEKVQSVLQNKLNSSMSNKNFTLIDDSVFTNLQNRINSLNADTAEKEINDLKIAITNLGNSDSQIVRLQNAISKYEIKIGGLKGKYKDIVPENELNEAISKLESLKKTLNSIQGGDSLSNKNISSILNDASSSMNRLSTATKNANQEAITFGSAFKDIASKVGLFSLAYTALNEFQQAFREGIHSVIQMDDALTDLAKVVDLNNNQLLQMRDNAVSMGEALGRSAVDVAKAQAEFGRQYKDIATINEMTRASIIGANVMDGASSDEVAKGLTTIINSLKLESKDAIPIIDSLNEVQNNYRISASSMLNALAEVGSTAKVAGADINQLQGYITAMSVATGKSGDEIGNSLRSITSRIYKIGTEGIESAGKPEKMLNDMGVAVRDLNNEFRPLNEILTDLNGKWKTMSETQKIGTAQTVAGVHRYNDFMALMENFDMAVDATATSMNSLGSATKENEIYLQSISGKMESLKATTQGFWFDFIDSDMLKGGVEGLKALMNGLSELQSIFGSLGLSVGALTTAFLLFTNNPLKSFITNVVSSGSIVQGFGDKLSLLKTKLSETTIGMGATQKASFLLKSGLEAVGNSAVVTQIKMMALQAVLSMGIGLVITAVIGTITKLISSLNTSAKSIQDVKMQSDALANSLDNVAKERDLTKQYESISRQLKDANLEENKRNDLKKQLDSIMKDLIASEQGYYGILNDENLTLDQQISKMEQIRSTKLFSEAKDLDKDMMSQSDIETKVQRLKEYIATYNDIKNALTIGGETGNYQKLIDLIGVADVDEANQILGETKNKINELDGEIIGYNGNVMLMKDANYETTRSLVSLDSNTSNFIDLLNKSTNAIDENTKAKKDNTSVDINSGEMDSASIEQATQAYGNALGELQKLYELQNKINEKQSISPELVIQLAKTYPQLGANITNTAYVQEFLNQKIAEQEGIAKDTYQSMAMSSKEYYDSTVKNTDEWQKYLVLVMNNLKDINADYYSENAEGMQNDLKNANSLAQARAIIESNLVKSLSDLWSKYYQKISEANWYTDRAVYQYAGGEGTKVYDETQKYLEAYNKIANKAEEIRDKFSNFSANISVPNIGANFVGTTSSGANSASQSAKKLSDNLEKLSKRYWDVENALKALDNEMAKNKTLMENATDKEKIKYLDKQLDLINKQTVAQSNLLKERKKELSELGNKVTSSGFNIGTNGQITNYQSRLDALVANANSITDPDSRESVQKNVKAIAEALERYNDLLLTQIPEVENSILDLKNTTIDTQKEIVDLIKKQKDTYVDNIKKETDALKKEISRRKELLNSQWDEEDFADEKRKKENALLDLNTQLADAMRLADDELIANIKKQIESAQLEIDNFIRDNERDKANQRFDDELEKIDENAEKRIEEITSKLTDEEILKMVQNGVRDLSSVLDSVGNANKAVTSSFVAVGDIIQNEWLGNLDKFLDKVKSVNGLNLDMNANINRSVTPTSSGKSVGDIYLDYKLIVEGNVDEDIMPEIDKKIKKSKDEIIREIDSKFRK